MVQDYVPSRSNDRYPFLSFEVNFVNVI